MFKKLLTVILVTLMSSKALAHAYHFGLTEMTINEQTRSLEIVHSYFVRDMAVAINGGNDIALDEAALIEYMDAHFALLEPKAGLLDLQWVGFEIDGENVVIYQEVPNINLESGELVVQSKVLVAVEPTQVNTINVLLANGEVRTKALNKEEFRAILNLLQKS